MFKAIWEPKKNKEIKTAEYRWLVASYLGPRNAERLNLDSALACCLLENRRAVIIPGVSDPKCLETYPRGLQTVACFLYYCSVSLPWARDTETLPDRFAEARYDLMRSPYDAQPYRWG